jgi:uncharacterized protein YegJ (DUF2314 family)
MKKFDLEIVFNRLGVKPKDKFYSTVYGEIYYNGTERYFSDTILTFRKSTTDHWSNMIDIKYNTEGILFGSEYKFGEMTLFPTKDIKDWIKWEELKCYNGDVGIGDYVVGLIGDATIENMFQKVFKVLDITDTHFKCICVCGRDTVDKTVSIRKDHVTKHSFIPNVYYEGMPVLVRNNNDECGWRADVFQSYSCGGGYICGQGNKTRTYTQCIPYNIETFNLLFTQRDCVPFYKRW